MPTIPPLHADLDFNSPLSDARAAQLVRSLELTGSERVFDFGCGWAELLLRVAERHPDVTCEGIDSDAAAIEHGRDNAKHLDNLRLHVGNAADWQVDDVDVAICVGSTHAWGTTSQALAALHKLINPGGRLLLGDGVWSRPPDAPAWEALGGDPDEFGTTADLVDLALQAGFRPLALSEASAPEWDDFESGYARGWERWLRNNPGDPEYNDVQANADAHRARWMRGYRGTLGFAYLTLWRSH